jgi:hypothetical protein
MEKSVLVHLLSKYPFPHPHKTIAKIRQCYHKPPSMYLRKIWHDLDSLVQLHLKFLPLYRTLCSVSQVPPGAKV